MKAIILAAGEGKRMRPLTLETPKPMVDILGRPLLVWIVEALPAEITELVFVVGYKAEQIQKYFGEKYEGRSVRYVYQEKPLGTGHALMLCKDFIAPGEKFLFMIGDDLHSPVSIKKLISEEFAMLVHEHENPRAFGVVEVDSHDRVIGFEEKPERPKSNLVSPAVFVMDDRIFKYPPVLHPKGEYFAVDQINQMMKDVPLRAIRSDFWHPVGEPHQITTAEQALLARGARHEAQKNATPVVIIAGGKGTRLPAEEQYKPKCLVEVAGKPILAHQLDLLRAQGFENITLSLGYKAQMVVDWLKSSGNESVKYVVETEPLGTGGGLRLAAGNFKEPFIAFNCDDLADVDFAGMIRHSCGGKYNVIVGMKFTAAQTFDSLICDEYKRVCEFRQRSTEIGDAIVNIGHYYLLPDIFDGMPAAFSNERDLFPRLAAAKKLVLQTHTGYWLTANNAEQIAGAREFFKK